ncbi:hypothetical protein M7I_6732 [Glarea lozoyensis 74030]|uniref:T6SS Phospholipase effector Tle1-like catalytic domain-containing protein n=1 Tax=Glarea lozoyensis (strain ATCC 74030 / MF5533) TaxID=1104152 RepID=H0EVD4_GLAL7|nr:hypothetical protein M7I_6732 [Glarea lozoyensis 74030]
MASPSSPDLVDAPLPKRIIICCDGTWYAADKGDNNLPSNVARLSRALKKVGEVSYGPEKGQKRAQVVYYQSGVGTGKLGTLDKVWQGAFGAGLDENVCAAYNFLVNNYAPGDDVFLFGFSRGAFTARAVAGLVCHAGLLKPHCMEQLFYNMYTAYRSRKPAQNGRPAEHLSETAWAKELYKSAYETEEQAAENEKRPTNWEMYAAHSDQDVQIKVIGVFDTVGSLGLPDGVVNSWLGTGEKYKFHNTSLDSKIKHAFHALALDEHRGSFSPTLWYIPETDDETLLKETRLVQCWFPGYHANIGGGTTGEGKDDNDIDEITFAWMCDLVKPYLTFDREAIKLIIPSKTDLPPVRFHMGKRTQTDSKIGTKKAAVKKIVKKVEVLTASYATSKLDDTYGISWKAAGGDVRRQPGEIKPLGDENKVVKDVETRECMHPCVAYREVYSGGAHRCPSLAPVKTGGWLYPTVDTKWEHRKAKDGNGFVM